MAATAIVTSQPTNVPPRMVLNLAGFTGASVVVIQRIDFVTGAQTLVRAGNPASLTSGAAVVYDYEVPFGTKVGYTVAPDVGSPVVSAYLTFTVVKPWLCHPGVPNLSQPITVAGMGDRTFDLNRGVHKVLGRSDPIVITDGARSLAAFDLIVRTSSDVAELGLSTLLQDGSPLLLQITYGTAKTPLYQWVSIGAVARSDLVQFFDNTNVQWTLACTVTAAPAGLLQTQRTWGDLLAKYPTKWRQVTTAYPTWRAALVGP